MHFEHTAKLPISRLQRDLTNIYVSGSNWPYSIIAFEATLKVKQITKNRTKFAEDLENGR
jgi:hypothetical protein